MKITTAYLGLGSNKGDRICYIENAVLEINKIKDTKVIQSSSVYETEPWGNVAQDDYLNSIIEIETELTAENLLKELKNIEKLLGRTGNKKWFEREIDIDLLFFGNEIIINDFMEVPHPQIRNRNFVLIPLNEIAPSLIHPVLQKTSKDLLGETKDNLKVSKYHENKIENI